MSTALQKLRHSASTAPVMYERKRRIDKRRIPKNKLAVISAACKDKSTFGCYRCSMLTCICECHDRYRIK